MAGFNVNDILAETQRSGIMRNNKFWITFPMPQGMRNTTISQGLSDTNGVLQLYCEQSNLPGIATLTEDIRRYGYGPNEKKPYAPIFSDVSLVLRGDALGKVWMYFNTWMRMAVNYEFGSGMYTPNGPLQNQLPYEVGYKGDYSVDVSISIFTESADENVSITLREAYPIYIGDMPLNWNSRSDYMRIPVTLTFFDWFNNLTSISYANTTNSGTGP